MTSIMEDLAPTTPHYAHLRFAVQEFEEEYERKDEVT